MAIPLVVIPVFHTASSRFSVPDPRQARVNTITTTIPWIAAFMYMTV